MGFLEVFNIGFFEAFYDFFNPSLSIFMYLALFVSFVVQSLLYRLTPSKFLRSILFILCIFGLAVGECLWHVVSIYRHVLLDVLMGLDMCALIGCVVAIVLHYFRKRRAVKNELQEGWEEMK